MLPLKPLGGGPFLPRPAPGGGQASLAFLGLWPHPSSLYSLVTWPPPCVSGSESLLSVLGLCHVEVRAYLFSARILVTSEKALFPNKATFRGTGIQALAYLRGHTEPTAPALG